ncbi:MAG: DUF4438 domain-containing protein [Candidatus Bathyarchaeia archaeon]|nr:DUF4438 domain-containing protein [Candidatus Bathyarchaeota archaeon]
MLRMNVERLVKISVMGEVSSPVFRRSAYKISSDGKPVVLPGVGGITYNVRVGDYAVGWAADHVEPGVSVRNRESDDANMALNILACIGNEAIIVSGDAKGAKGVVVGKHGGIDHVLVDFRPEIMEKLLIGDKILIKAFGVGLELIDYPDIKVMNVDPNFLAAMGLQSLGDKIEVPVTHIIPASIMGSGLGSDHAYSGDYDIQLFDEAIVKEYGLEDLRLGDIVAIKDADNSYGRIYLKGAMSIGIIVHSNCIVSGHGPGVVTILTSRSGKIVPRIDSNANIAKILKLRHDI